MKANWISFARWVAKRRNPVAGFRDFASERHQYLLGEETTKLPSWKKRLAPWAHIKDSLLQSPVMSLQIPKLDIAYLRIPKAGSSSVLRHLLPLVYPYLPGELDQRTLEAYTYQAISHKRPQKGLRQFTVVRHPVSRLLSTYASNFLVDDGRFPFQHYLWGSIPQKASLEEFIDAVNHIPDRFRDPHFMSQTRLLGGKKELSKVHFYQLEALAEGQKIIELGLTLPTSNPGPTIPLPNIHTIQKIEHIYQEDMVHFGYSSFS